MASIASVRQSALSVVALLVIAGCSSGDKRDRSDPLPPGPLAAQELRLRLLEAKPGAVIRLAPGRFALTTGLVLEADRVTLRGAGAEETLLSFVDQTGAEAGLRVTGDDVRLEGFALEDTRGDGIRSEGADRIIYRDLRVQWNGGPKSTNGAQGIHAIDSKDVLIDGVTVRGAAVAGIHVDRSRSVIVRRSRVEFNVVGIRVGNSSKVDVFDNVVTRNAGGVLVVNVPDLVVKDGRDIRVFDNQVFANDTPNFAPSDDVVADMPAGTGIMLRAARGVHVYRNQLSMNRTTHLLVTSHLLPIKDPYFDPFPGDIVVRDNRYGAGGDDPQGMLQRVAEDLGGPLPPIVWDGVTAHRMTVKAPALALLEPRSVGVLDLALARTPIDLAAARPVAQRPPAVAAPAEPEPVVVPQDPL